MKTSSSGSLLIRALAPLPKNAISRLAGRLVSLRLPGPLQRLQIRFLGWWFGVDFDEVRDPIESFASFQDFFIRKLVDGARPIDSDIHSFVSPCDGAWGEVGLVRDGTLLQVKGRPYTVGALLGDDVDAKRFEGGAFATIYLSPRDYHRFHAPCDARVSRLRYLPGTLWPVNRAGVEGVDQLFAQNERICAFMELTGELEGECVCLAAVGATMVGKVRISFDEISTNIPGAHVHESCFGDRPFALAKGDEWGRFEFGSTIVMVATAGAVALDVCEPGSSLKMGTRIGTIGAGQAS